MTGNRRQGQRNGQPNGSDGTGQADDLGDGPAAADESDEAEPVDVQTLDSSWSAIITRNLRDIADRPSRIFTELNRAFHWRFGLRDYNPDGVDIFQEDWDSLVVLDACRYDMFEELNTLPGRLDDRVSRGSNTYEFFVGNFDGRDLRDTVYVTANPRFFRRRDDIDVTFHDVINVWREGWDASEGTVTPDVTTDYAIEAAEEYPNKRLLIHYMQPHFPFVGWDIDTGELIDERNPSVWDLARDGELDTEEVRRAYHENLEVTLPELERLLDRIDGRTVITSDHGNMMGERAWPVPAPVWGHPLGVYTPELVRVPWLVHESGPRRTVVAEETQARDRPAIDESVVKERLERFGYVT